MRMLHVIPEDGIGGVEIAACRAAERLDGALRVQFLKPHGTPGENAPSEARIAYGTAANALDIRNAFCAVRTARAFDPGVIVFSLWKTIVAFLVMRLLLRDRKFVLFVHSDRSSHVFDRLATSLMARWSHAVWADSASALEGRLGERRHRLRTRIISFILHKSVAIVRDGPKPLFAYWGRLNRIKGIDQAIALFYRIAVRRPDARFLIIGPDSGALEGLKQQVHGLGLDGRVTFAGAMTMPEISEATADASFFIQLSKQEGMAMSVIEAMQLGLVPVVTPVGAIKDYCRDEENAVVFSGIEDAADRIEVLLGDADLYRATSRSAMAQWTDAPLYQDDFIMAARDVIDATQA